MEAVNVASPFVELGVLGFGKDKEEKTRDREATFSTRQVHALWCGFLL